MAETKKPKKFIQRAVPPSRRGVFRDKAERAGKTTREYASEHAGDKGTLGKEARLAETLMSMHKGRAKRMYRHPKSQSTMKD